MFSVARIKKLQELDWGFANQETRYLTHPIHRYSSKFPPQIASQLIETFTEEGERVLDNFVGSGTSLLEANLLRRHSIGIDPNPVACLISSTKVTPIPIVTLKVEIDRIVSTAGQDTAKLHGQRTLTDNESQDNGLTIKQKLSDQPNSQSSKISHWFFRSDLEDLIVIGKAVEETNNVAIRRLAMVSLSEILRRCSKAHSSYPNLMINRNSRPKGNAFIEFRRQLTLNAERVMQLDSKFALGYEPQVIRGDARDLSFIRDESFHFIISHPPYIAAVPYAEFLALSLLWLGYDPRKIDLKLIGGRRRSKDITARYLKDIEVVFREMLRVLKPFRYCCVVIGNPVVFGKLVPLNERLIEIGKYVGFQFLTELSRRRVNMRKGILRDEYILVFRKTNSCEM